MVAWIGYSSGYVSSGQNAVRSQLCHLLSVCPWADYLTSLSLYLLIWETRLVIILSYKPGAYIRHKHNAGHIRVCCSLSDNS